MKTKNIRLVYILLLFSLKTLSQNHALTKNKKSYLPDYMKVQFAGNIGFFSIGIGYQFFNEHLYSELLYGYIPASVSMAKDIHLITVKNTFPILTKEINKIYLSPIIGCTTSFETGNNSYLVLPDKYPDGYYKTNAFHFTFFLGTLLHKNFINSNKFKGFDFYYELGTVETYLWYAILSKEVKINRVLSSAIGINLFF